LSLTDPSGFETDAADETKDKLDHTPKDWRTLGGHRSNLGASTIDGLGVASRAGSDLAREQNNKWSWSGMVSAPNGASVTTETREKRRLEGLSTTGRNSTETQANRSGSGDQDRSATTRFTYVDSVSENWTPLAEGQKLVGFEFVSPAMVAIADALTTFFPQNLPTFVGGYDAIPLLANIRLEQMTLLTSTKVFEGTKLISEMNVRSEPTATLREVFQSSDWKTGSTQFRPEWLIRGPRTKLFPGVDDAMIRSRWRDQGVTIDSNGVPQFRPAREPN
jgi:hypothetical protein